MLLKNKNFLYLMDLYLLRLKQFIIHKQLILLKINKNNLLRKTKLI